MTTNILEAIKQAYSAGLTDGARQAEVIARIHAEHAQGTSGPKGGDTVGHFTVTSVTNGARKRPGRVAKASSPLKTGVILPKAPKARSSRKAAGPREKGVKERIVGMIAAGPLTVAEIIAHTGFKSTSVRATLMSLKKAGLAIQDGNTWQGEATRAMSGGNSEGEAANV